MKTIERIITAMVETIANAAATLNCLIKRVVFELAFKYGNIRGLMKYYEINWKDIVIVIVMAVIIVSGYAALWYAAYITNC